MLTVKVGSNFQKIKVDFKTTMDKQSHGVIFEQIFFYWKTPTPIPFLGLQREVFPKDNTFDVGDWKTVFKKKYNQASQDEVDDILEMAEMYIFNNKERKEAK